MNRKRWSKEEKITVVLEMIRGGESVAAICTRHGVSATQAYRWLPSIFLWFYSLGLFVLGSYDKVRIGLPSCHHYNFFRLADCAKSENYQSHFGTETGLSKPVSRVLYSPKANGDHLSSPGVTPGVKRPTRGLSRTSHMPPYSVLLRMGFAQPTGRPAAGELLPHHFTLIRLRRTVCFCGTVRRVAPPGCYPASCPVELGLSSRQRRAVTRFT
jgi:hypothetical protein